MQNNKSLKGFTLLELLIVIAILAVLSTVVVLVLNPAEYLAQARDSQRVSDLATLNSAINLYLATTATINWGNCTSVKCTAAGTIPGGAAACGTISSSTAVGGTGWIPIDFSGLNPSPISREPIDPTNSGAYKYAYHCSTANNTFELSAKMESAKYVSGGGGDLESNAKDGGNNNSAYETGSNLTLIGS